MTKLGRIPNLFLSSPPIQKTPALAKDIDTGMDIINNADPAEFPNSVPDNTLPVTATPCVHTEDPDYNKDLDSVLLASIKGGKPKRTCPVHPQCITNIGDKPTSPPAKTSTASITLTVLKRQCKVKLHRLTEEQLKQWKPLHVTDSSTSSSSDSSSTDSDKVPLSELAKQLKSTQPSDGFTSEDDILLCNINKPRMRSHTHTHNTQPTIKTGNRFPRKTKTGVTYVDSELSDISTDQSPARKKSKLNPLLLPGPSDSRLRSQQYIASKKGTPVKENSNSNHTPLPPPPVNSVNDAVEYEKEESSPQKGKLQV